MDGLINVRIGEAMVLHRHELDAVNFVKFTPDGKRIIFGDATSLQVWDAEKKVMLHRSPIWWVETGAVSPDGKRVIASTGEGALRMWDMNTGQEALTLVYTGRWVGATTFRIRSLPSR